MKEFPKKIQIASTALMQKVSGEMVILDTQNGQYYTLNHVAADMLELMQQGLTTEQTVVEICKQYDVSVNEATEDLYEMIRTLSDKQLVQSTE